MRLSFLQADGFLPLRGIDIDLDGFNFITGGNNEGKTSINNAVEWIITGETRMTKGSKIAEKYLVNDDPDVNECEGTVKIDDLKITRNLTKNSPSQLHVERDGEKFPPGPKSHSKTEKQEAIYEYLGLNEDLVHFLLDGLDYVQISAADRREQLFTIFGADDEDHIRQLLNESTLSESHVESVKGVLDESCDSIDDLIDHYETLRREAKRKRKDAKRQQEKADPVEIVEVDCNYTEDIELPYDQALHKRDNEYKEYRHRLKEELDAMEFQGNYDGPTREKIEDKLDQITMKLDELPEESKLEDKISDIKAEILKLEEKQKAASNGEGRCIYDDSHACPVNEETISNFADEAERKIESLQSDLQEYKDVRSRVSELVDRQRVLESKLEKAPTEDKVEQRKKLRAKINELDKIVEAINQAEEANEAYEDAESDVNSANSSINRCNDIVTSLETIKEKIIVEAIEDYRQRLNEISFLFEEEFEITDDLELLLKGRPSYALSGSELLRLAYANQIALSLVTGAQFFALDEVDILFGENRSKLLKVLKAFEDEIDSAIISFSSDMEEPVLEGSRTYVIEEGRI